MNMVGELVLARNQLVRGVLDDRRRRHLIRTAQRLGMITSELQEGIMKTRMQPIDHIWSKLPRVVRDLSSSLGKQVQLSWRARRPSWTAACWRRSRTR